MAEPLSRAALSPIPSSARLSERERLLFALFGGRSGMTEADAISALLTLHGNSSDAPEMARIRSAIAGMRAAGVLVAREELSLAVWKRDSAYFDPQAISQAAREGNCLCRGHQLQQQGP